MDDIIAIIPARGNSKGIPEKNIKEIAGKPLIYYTIESAKKVKEIKRIIVSTENSRVKFISKSYGVEIIDRPPSLALDNTPMVDVVLHVLTQLNETENYEPNIIILLQPTSPLRNSIDIWNALKIFRENPSKCVISVKKWLHSPYLSLKINNGYLEPLFNKNSLKTPRQEFEPIYLPNGAIYITTPKLLIENQTFYCKNSIPYIMSPENSIDIDCEFEFRIAEYLIRTRG